MKAVIKLGKNGIGIGRIFKEILKYILRVTMSLILINSSQNINYKAGLTE